MLQKVCGGKILHVMTYAIFPEMLKNRAYSFLVLFSFSNRSAFFSKCFFMFEIPDIPFSESDGKNGAIREKST